MLIFCARAIPDKRIKFSLGALLETRHLKFAGEIQVARAAGAVLGALGLAGASFRKVLCGTDASLEYCFTAAPGFTLELLFLCDNAASGCFLHAVLSSCGAEGGSAGFISGILTADCASLPRSSCLSLLQRSIASS